jgi:hypothetical protein
MSTKKPKVPRVPPPPLAPTRAAARSSLISTSTAGLTKRADTKKKKLTGTG